MTIHAERSDHTDPRTQGAARTGFGKPGPYRHAEGMVGTEPIHQSTRWSEVRVGGEMHITMHGPKGSPYDMDFPMIKRYREIVPGRKLVFDNEPIRPTARS